MQTSVSCYTQREDYSIHKERGMQGSSGVDEGQRFKSAHTGFQRVQEYGVRELDVTLIRPTN
jgi:hypothetical protein